jgi:hypothetical protein
MVKVRKGSKIENDRIWKVQKVKIQIWKSSGLEKKLKKTDRKIRNHRQPEEKNKKQTRENRLKGRKTRNKTHSLSKWADTEMTALVLSVVSLRL